LGGKELWAARALVGSAVASAVVSRTQTIPWDPGAWGALAEMGMTASDVSFKILLLKFLIF